ATLALAGGGRPPAGWLGPLCVLLGASAAGFTLTWAIAREVNPLRYSGIATATVNAGGFVGAAVLQSTVSAVVDARWRGAVQEGARSYPVDAYRAAWMLCFGVAVAAWLLSLAVAETRGRNVHAVR
ncbi:MAG: MFS transporter, partial [Gemmatimonadota bacterium]|nr:MFS transporter [Gemmatimonadota bacterium]